MRYQMKSDPSVQCEAQVVMFAGPTVIKWPEGVRDGDTVAFYRKPDWDSVWESVSNEKQDATPPDEKLDIVARIHQYLESVGRRHAKLAIVPDDLFREAKDEVQKMHSVFGGKVSVFDDVVIDCETVLVGMTQAHDELRRYREILAAIK